MYACKRMSWLRSSVGPSLFTEAATTASSMHETNNQAKGLLGNKVIQLPVQLEALSASYSTSLAGGLTCSCQRCSVLDVMYAPLLSMELCVS